MKWLVKYPSGKEFTLEGTIRVETTPNTAGVTVTILDGLVAHALDPRACVVSLNDGLRYYTPRRHTFKMSPDMVKWLKTHPEWEPLQ